MRFPEDKFDLDAVTKLEAIGYLATAPLLDRLVDWVADGNWPVARPVADLLVSTGAGVIPALLQLLRGRDAIHQYFALLLVVDRLPLDVAALLRSDLKQLVMSPSPEQIQEGAFDLAEGILRKLGSSLPRLV
jgi:Domain of unknown function (DUF5071)